MNHVSERHPLLDAPNTYELANTMTVLDIHDRYLVPELRANTRRPSTVCNVARSVGRWEEWWKSLSSERLPIAVIRRKHMQCFREWLSANGHSAAGQNEACRTVRQVLLCAVRHEILAHAPAIESVDHRGVAPKVFQSDEQINDLWEACDAAEWPRFDANHKRLPYSPATAWRVAILLYRTYGFRTQELIRHEANFRALQWSSLFRPGLTPNPVGRCECEHGWISYVPQKQERKKPDPLVVPITKHVRAALSRVVPVEMDREQPILNWIMSSVGFYRQWHGLNELAGIKPRDGSGVRRYLPKHFRKAATTGINLHRSGMAEHVVGHGADRSGQSSISSKHYDNAEAAVLECMMTLPVPSCFETI